MSEGRMLHRRRSFPRTQPLTLAFELEGSRSLDCCVSLSCFGVACSTCQIGNMIWALSGMGSKVCDLCQRLGKTPNLCHGAENLQELQTTILPRTWILTVEDQGPSSHHKTLILLKVSSEFLTNDTPSTRTTLCDPMTFASAYRLSRLGDVYAACDCFAIVSLVSRTGPHRRRGRSM